MSGFKSKAQAEFFAREAPKRGGAFQALAQQRKLDTPDLDALPDRVTLRPPRAVGKVTAAARARYYPKP